MSPDTPIIIGGCGSSGTTLLVSLLGRHSQVSAGPEMSLFNHPEVTDLEGLRRCYQLWFRGRLMVPGYHQVCRFLGARRHYGVTEVVLQRWIEESRNAAEFFAQICAHMRGRFGKARFAEKTPTNVYAFAAIARSVPSVPLIHVVRDGRDVVASLLRRGYSVFRAASRWLFDTAAGLQARAHASYREVRYEELVTAPERVLRCLFTGLGLEFEPEILESTSAARARLTGSIGTWGQQPVDPISSKSVGSFRSVLTPPMLRLASSVTLTEQSRALLCSPGASFAELLEVLGYDSEPGESEPSALPCCARAGEWFDHARRALHALPRALRWPLPLTFVATTRSAPRPLRPPASESGARAPSIAT